MWIVTEQHDFTLKMDLTKWLLHDLIHSFMGIGSPPTRYSLPDIYHHILAPDRFRSARQLSGPQPVPVNCIRPRLTGLISSAHPGLRVASAVSVFPMFREDSCTLVLRKHFMIERTFTCQQHHRNRNARKSDVVALDGFVGSVRHLSSARHSINGTRAVEE